VPLISVRLPAVRTRFNADTVFAMGNFRIPNPSRRVE
jgi:hypothetical protein